MEGEASTAETVRRACLRFSTKNGISLYRYANCGRKSWKLTPDVEKWLVRAMLRLRKTQVVTSITLQRVLLDEKGITELNASYLDLKAGLSKFVQT